jgi:thiamine biosynthesis lipoprotein
MKIAGFTQGTTYNITYEFPDTTDLKPQVDSILKVFDMSFSLYEPQSLISKINRNEENQVNFQFKEVFIKSQKVWEESDGYFDVTVLPLVDAWGFGPGEKMELDKAIVDSLMEFIGMNKLRLENNHLIKDHPDIRLDFNAIAQGYSVDIVAKYFDKLGINNYMIEIGGEIRTKGLNPNKQVWKIGVDRPEFGNMIPGQHMQVILRMRDKALATSGNYRKFYEVDGIKYTHSINPKTGFPSRNTLLSTTVLANDCMTADAWATAFMVMGLEKSIETLEKHKELDAYLIYGDDIGRYQAYLSKKMRRYIFQELQ